MQVHTNAHRGASEAIRVVRELQTANVPAAVVSLTGRAVGNAHAEHASNVTNMTGEEQLQQTGLPTEDFAAVSSVRFSGAVLQPEMLDVTMSMIGREIAPSRTLLLSNLPLDLKGFQEAGFRVGEVQPARQTKLQDKATADITFSGWDEIEAHKLLQLRELSSSTVEALEEDSSYADCSTSTEVQQPQSEPYSTAHASPGHERRRERFPQMVSMSLLELHSDEPEPALAAHGDSPTPPSPASLPYTPHNVPLSAITDLPSPHYHSVLTSSAGSWLQERDAGMHERHTFGGDSGHGSGPAASVPLAKEAVAAAFLSVDEELDDDLGALDGAAVHAVGAVPQHAPSCAASAHDSDTSAQDIEDTTNATDDKATSSVVDWDADPDPMHASYASLPKHNPSHSSIVDWAAAEPEAYYVAGECTKVLQGTVRVCPESSLMEAVPGASKMEVIKQQAQTLEDTLAMDARCDSGAALLATAALDKALLSYKLSRTYSFAYDDSEDSSQKVPEAESSKSGSLKARSIDSAAGKSSKEVVSSAQNGSFSKDPEPSACSSGGNGNTNEAESERDSNDSKSLNDVAATAAGSGSGGRTTEIEATPEATSGWLEGTVPLPGGYKTTRRDVLRLLPLGGALGSFGFLLSRAKSLEFVGPKAILAALLPRSQPTPEATDAAEVRRAAFKRFIASVERRGSSENVPEFPAGAQWYNTGGPLKLSRELSGRVLVLDFWTFCCVNCMHVLPELSALERKFADEPVTVVGVHSAKFDNEKDARAVRSAVLRYDIEHPVVNDTQRALWGALGISSWPTQVVVSPTGKVLFTVAGEGHAQDIEDCVAAAVDYYGEQGALRNEVLPLVLEKDKPQAVGDTALRFPGKLAVDELGNRLFIADSSNHRIVVTSLDGQHLVSIGGIGAGLRDGVYDEAAFHGPQGVCFSAATGCLYVADTDNHAIRCIDFEKRSVTTLAGNGTQGRDYRGGGAGRAQPLSSPWDVTMTADDSALLIAMAGQHQIWRLDLSTSICANISGTGAEQNLNGSTAATTAWAQPSGISLSSDGSTAYVADAESSSIRALNVATGGSTLLAGGDAFFADNLFQYGDKDGSGSAARLQHPLATACAPRGAARSTAQRAVYFADSYNHRIKVLDPETRAVKTIAGNGTVGFLDAPGVNSQFSEPGGLVALSDGSLLVADTNNSVIRRLTNPRNGGVWDVATVQLSGVPDVSTRELLDKKDLEEVPRGGIVVQAEAVEGLSGTLEVKLKLPDGYHLTEGAGSGWSASVKTNSTLSVGTDSSPVQVSAKKGAFNWKDPEPSLRITYSGVEGAEAVASITLSIYFCQDGDVCLLDTAVVHIPIKCTEFPGQSSTANSSVVYNVRKPSSGNTKLAL